MSRDDLEALRAANPVPTPVAYSADDVARHVDDIVASGGVRTAATSDDAPAGQRRWLLPALAASVVLVVAVVSAIVFTARDSSDTVAGAGRVTCTVSTRGGAAAIRNREKQAAEVIKTRADQLGGTARRFTHHDSDGTIGFTADGIDATKAAHACRATTTAIRPLITSPVVVDTNQRRTPRPLADLGFPVPSGERAFARLSAARQAKLRAAMSHYNCAGVVRAADPALMCDRSNGSAQVYLLAAEIVGAADVRTATAMAPSAPDGIVEWTVLLGLDRDAGARLAVFTARNHTSSTAVNPSTCGPADDAACGDFLAFSVNGTVISLPVTTTTLSGPLLVSGNFDENSARSLAATYTAASIGLRPS